MAYGEELLPKVPWFSDISAEEARRKSERAETLLTVANKLAATLSLDEVLETLVDLVTGVIDAERGSLFLYDGQTEELYSLIAQGDFTREIDNGDGRLAGSK